MNQKKVILIVEDELPLLKILTNKFSNEGIHVLEAKNGEEGLIVALKEHPDLILLDIIMPKMDGMTMLKNLREDVWGKDVKIIILTNLSDEGQVATAMSEKVFDYLIKTDWKIEDLVKKVKEKLEIS